MENGSSSKAERVMIFIDGSNFYHSVRGTFGLFHEEIEDVEVFKKLIEFLRGERMLIGIRYYNAPLDRGYNEEKYWNQQKFFDRLRSIPGFKVVKCTMRKTKLKDGKYKFRVKGDDIYLAVDMVSGAYEDQYDTAILVSGDGDFKPAILRVRKLGKKVENAYFYISRSGLLRRICDKSIPLDEFLEESCFRTATDKKDDKDN